MKKLIVGILVSLNFSMIAYADGGASCSVYRAEGPELVKIPITLSVTTQENTSLFKISYANFKSGVDFRSYSFSFAGKADKKEVTGVMSLQGNMGVGNATGEATWTVVNSGGTAGYIKAKKGKHPQIGKGILGEALLPFINNNKKVVVNCTPYSSGSFSDCLFCF